MPNPTTDREHLPALFQHPANRLQRSELNRSGVSGRLADRHGAGDDEPDACTGRRTIVRCRRVRRKRLIIVAARRTVQSMPSTEDDLVRFVTADQIGHYVRWEYRRHMLSDLAPLPSVVANPAALMERSVQLGGADGLTSRELLGLFDVLGPERRDHGIRDMKKRGHVTQTWETRSDAAGQARREAVFRFHESSARSADSG